MELGEICNNAWITKNNKAYMNELVFIKWIDKVFPNSFFIPDEMDPKCLIVDAAPHRSSYVV